MNRNNLHAFYGASCLKKNGAKLKAICSPGIPKSLKDGIHNIAGISFTNNFRRYLGVPFLQG